MAGIADIIQQMISNGQQSPQQNAVTQALSQRFQPTMDDIGTAAINTSRSYAPNSQFKAVNPDQIAQTRVANELAPYTTAMDLQGQGQKLAMNQQEIARGPLKDELTRAQIANYQALANSPRGGVGGGATGAMVQQLMQSTGMSFPEALYQYQTGFRQGTTYQPGQGVSALQGAAQAKGQIKQGEAFGGALGKEFGEKAGTLNSIQSSMPQLEATVNQLSQLGQNATYTMAGQMKNNALRQAGLPVGQGAEDRAAYIAIVDNQILPLLRQTFGAQFTEREGQTLRQTLGNPDLSPAEKDAQLRSFIEQKKATAQSLQREVSSGVPDYNAIAQGISGNAPAPIPSADPFGGAKQAPDGHMYIPDPQRPGKYLRVD